MLVSRGRNPSAAEVVTQLVLNKELRQRVLITLGMLLLVRLGIYIPVPGINREAFQDFSNYSLRGLRLGINAEYSFCPNSQTVFH